MKEKRGDILWRYMAMEAEKSDPRAAHTVPAIEHKIADGPVDAINEEHIAGWTAEKAERPAYPIDVAKLTEEQRNKIVEDIRNFEKLNQMIVDNNAISDKNIAMEKKYAQAAATGGNMQPPTEPVYDPSTVLPQTEVPVNHPAFENPAVESGLDTAARLTKQAGGYMQEKVADSMQYGFLGKLEPKLDRLGIRFLNAPRRMLLEGLYKWRSERAFMANQDLEKANQVVAEKEKALAEQDAKRDAFLAEEKKNGWSIGSSAIKLESERAKAVKRIEAVKQDRDAKQVKLETWNTKKTFWENKQKDIARDMASTVNLHPRVINANADFIAQTKHKDNITNQLGLWESARTKAQEHLAKLEAKLKSADTTYIEEESITGQIDEIKKILAEGDKKYKDYVGRKNAADAKIQKINTYLGGWNTFKNELGRTGENNRYDDPGAQSKVKVGDDRDPTMSHAPTA